MVEGSDREALVVGGEGAGGVHITIARKAERSGDLLILQVTRAGIREGGERQACWRRGP